MKIIGFILLALAFLIAFGNLAGVYQATQRRRRGIPGGFSCVPLFSLIFSLAALGFLYPTTGYWALLPAILDPATWSLAYLPFFLIWRAIRGI